MLFTLKSRLSAAITAVLVVFAGPLVCGGQTGPGSTGQTMTPHPIPLHHRYAYFLKYQIDLDKKADALAQQGYPDKAAEIRGHLQSDLHFTNDQIAIMRKAGLQLKYDLADLRAREIPVISEDRKWGREHGRKAGPPPGANRIHELQREHETLLLTSVEKLNEQLGPEAAARLQTYVDAHVTGHTTQIPSRKPKIGTPFHLEARQ